MMFVCKPGEREKTFRGSISNQRAETNKPIDYTANGLNADNPDHIKRGFLTSALLSFFFISGHVTANADGAYNISAHDDTKVSVDKPNSHYLELGLGRSRSADGDIVNTLHELHGQNATTIEATHVANIKYSCSDVKNKSSREICVEFAKNIMEKSGLSYEVHFIGLGGAIKGRSDDAAPKTPLPPNQTGDHPFNKTITEKTENEELPEKKELLRSQTIYILPKTDIWVEDIIDISNVANIAIIGDADDDGNYPTLKGTKNITMFDWVNCQHCMVANVNIDPTTENDHSLAFQVSGKKTEIEFRNIAATHSRTGLLAGYSAKSITLENVIINYEPESRDTETPLINSNVMSLNNCAKIKAKNVGIYDFRINPYALHPSVIDILNPVDIDFEDIHIGLSESSSVSKDMAYIGLAFSDMKQDADRVVNGTMKGLYFGEFTRGKAPENVTIPDYWPDHRHVLSLSERGIYPVDTTRVTGQIDIESNDYLQAIANQPGVEMVTGEDLFYDLKVTFPGLISPTVDFNLDSLPQYQNQTGDDSGLSFGAKVGIGVGSAIFAAILVGGGYKLRHKILLCLMIPFHRLASMKYQQGFNDKATPDLESQADKVYQATTESLSNPLTE